MPVPCRISLDAGTPLVISTSVATMLVQGTNSSSKPTRLKRIQLQSNNLGSAQQPVTLQLITYATATSTGGTTPTAQPEDDALVGVYTPSTLFRVNTTTMGTTPTVKFTYTWNSANPFDLLDGLEELQTEFAVSKVWALIIPTAGIPTAAMSVTGTINFEEFG